MNIRIEKKIITYILFIIFGFLQRTYLLGQNIPLTTDELAAREIKRQKAMELQEAIKQQVNTVSISNFSICLLTLLLSFS